MGFLGLQVVSASPSYAADAGMEFYGQGAEGTTGWPACVGAEAQTDPDCGAATAPAVLPETATGSSTDKLCTALAGTEEECQQQPVDENKLLEAGATIVRLMSLLAGIFALIFIMVAGFRFMIARGEGGPTSGARRALFYALLGLIVVALSQLLVRFILNQTADISG